MHCMRQIFAISLIFDWNKVQTRIEKLGYSNQKILLHFNNPDLISCNSSSVSFPVIHGLPFWLSGLGYHHSSWLTFPKSEIPSFYGLKSYIWTVCYFLIYSIQTYSINFTTVLKFSRCTKLNPKLRIFLSHHLHSLPFFILIVNWNLIMNKTLECTKSLFRKLVTKIRSRAGLVTRKLKTIVKSLSKA